MSKLRHLTERMTTLLPESVTKGASGGPQVTSSSHLRLQHVGYRHNDRPNGLTTTVNTRDAALRPTLITYPTGATKSASYNDCTPSVSRSLSYSDGGTQKTVSGSTVYDNLGRVIQQVDANGAQVNTAYDVMGTSRQRHESVSFRRDSRGIDQLHLRRAWAE